MTPITSKNIFKFYGLTALTNLWFFTGSWLYFYRLYMSDRQIGLLDGVVFGLGLLAEIPSGALADLLGRKKLLCSGILLMSVGLVSQGLATGYLHIFGGMLCFTVGMAMVSGSDDALIFDSLVSEGNSKRWRSVVARKQQIIMTVTILSYLFGGLLYLVHKRLPFVLSGVGAILGFVVAISLTEAKVVKTKVNITVYIKQTKDGMLYLLHRRMGLYLFIAIVVLGTSYAFDVGVIKPLVLDKLGYYASAQAVINAIVAIIAILALTQLNRLRGVVSERVGFIVLAFVLGIGIVITALPIHKLGILAFLMIYIVYSLVGPWLNDIVQNEVPSSHRATALSTLALLQKMPYILLAPLAGAMSSSGHLDRFLLGMGLCVLVSIVILIGFGWFNKIKRTRQLFRHSNR